MQSSKYGENCSLAASAKEARAVTAFSLINEIPLVIRLESFGRATAIYCVATYSGVPSKKLVRAAQA